MAGGDGLGKTGAPPEKRQRAEADGINEVVVGWADDEGARPATSLERSTSGDLAPEVRLWRGDDDARLATVQEHGAIKDRGLAFRLRAERQA